MEKFLRDYDKKYIKTTILKHEETFRQQVNELHRLYRVQKDLMHDMKNNQQKKQRILDCIQATPGDQEIFMSLYIGSENKRMPRRALNLDLPADEYIERAEQDRQLEMEQDIDIELKLTTGRHWMKKEDVPFTTNSGLSLSSSSSASFESERLNFTAHEWRKQVEDAEFIYRFGNKSYFDHEEGNGEDKPRQEPWRFQYLSLKMT